MHVVWIFILGILKFFSTTYTIGDDYCKSTEKCECINVTSSGNLEFQCPSSYDENKTITHVYRSSKKITIDCSNIEDLQDSFLPVANLSTMTKLEILECPLPTNGFTELIRKFFLKNLEYLSFTDYILTKPLTIEDMNELENLRTFSLKNNNMSVLGGEIFKNTPKLSDLTIGDNNINLNENIFENIPNLLHLSITNNKIHEIPHNAFNFLSNLRTLSLWGNNLRSLEHGIFDNLVSLTMLELSLNEIENIEDQTFYNLTNLKQINLRRNKLKKISRRVFENCLSIELIKMDENPNIKLVDDVFSYLPKLKIINLANNELDHVSENLFKGSTNLMIIDLSKNHLKKLPNKIFSNMDKLEKLYLHHNDLDAIDEGLLESLKNLKEIDLSYNKIVRMSSSCLSRNKNLEKFLMSHNQFDFDESTEFPGDLFSSFSSTNLKEVDLSYNNITSYPYNLNGIATMESIQLQHNNIISITVDRLTTTTMPLSIDLSFNKIRQVDFLDPNPLQPSHDAMKSEIQLSGNPIHCDCRAFNLARYVQENNHPVREYVDLKYDELKCAGPQKLTDLSLKEVRMNELTCTLDKNCTSSQSCDCVYRPSDKTMVIDCSRRNLTEVPELSNLSVYRKKYDMNQTEINLEKNLLQRCPGELDGYQNTSRWYLKGNAIRNITWIPQSLRMLDLRENQIETVETSTLKVLNGSKLNNLYLGKNPWNCKCGLEAFLVYLRSHINQIDMSDIHCNNTKIRLVDLNDKDLCPVENDILVFTVVMLSCLFFIAASLSIYFLYQKEILIWLYGRGYCLWMVKEDEMDKDKIYDAFISFSNKDHDFVVENLVSVLESGKDPYKLCIHFRDWIPGELIQTQIIHSVRDSRRTIVVLSANFLESIWGIVEFKTAHNEAMRERRARVIIIICGDLNMDALDEDLKAYLKTNTYIKWGDPWFWDKLKYALPKRSGRQILSKKHANMMQYIEDKFILMDKQPTFNVSTPIILSPIDLEEKPLTCIA